MITANPMDDSPANSAAASNWQICNRVKADPMFGLIRLECDHLSGRDLSGSTACIAFGGKHTFLAGEALLAPYQGPGTVIRLHLVTHLAANGLQPVSGEIRWPDGFVWKLPGAQYDIQNIGELAAKVRQDLLAADTAIVLPALVDSAMLPGPGGVASAWLGDDDPAADVPLSLEPSATDQEARLHMMRWGFAVLPYAIEKDVVTQFRSQYEAAIDDGRLTYRRGSSDRVHQAHRLPAGRSIWMDARILEFLRVWFRDEPCACQTLLYLNGSEQAAHQDTIHLTPYPAGLMSGVWVALQDVEPGSGELFVFPGSHRAPRIMGRDLGLSKVTDDYSEFVHFSSKMDSLIAAGGYERMVYRPKCGQVLVWHENLIHGGAPRHYQDRSRHSIVSHYYARGSIAYYDARGEGASLELVE